jgi:hypothetical protein
MLRRNGRGQGRVESWAALQELAGPLAKCALLGLTAQLSPGGGAAVMFGGPMLEGFEPDRRNLMVGDRAGDASMAAPRRARCRLSSPPPHVPASC